MKPSAMSWRNLSPAPYVASATLYRGWGGGGALVPLGGLDPDDARLDVVDAADPVRPRHRIEGLDDREEVHPTAAEGDRDPFLEREVRIRRLLRGLEGRRRPCERLLRGLEERVLQDAGLDGPPPEVLIRAVWRGLRHRDGDAALPRVLDLLIPGHPPDARGRDHLEIRGECGRAQVEADLVVPLSRAPVGDEVRVLLARHVDEMLPDEGPGEGRAQGILPLVEGVRLQRAKDVLLRELSAGVDDVRVPGA